MKLKLLLILCLGLSSASFAADYIQYDLNGRPTSIGGQQIQYDLNGRQTSIGGQ